MNTLPPSAAMSEVNACPSQVEALCSSAQMSPDARGCRFCGQPLQHVVVDLGLQPLCQNIVVREDLNKPEICYPLRAYVCDSCWLVQVHEHVPGDQIFRHYAYFSSYSDSWLEHCRCYVDEITARLQLTADSQVVEIASNDGYLLQYFQQKAIPAWGIEPAANVAQVAQERGISCIVKFFGRQTAREVLAQGIQPDLLLGNNVLAHVPDLNDFVAGLKILLKPSGVITLEFPHLMQLIEQNQFDTIYQEHYCYFSLLSVRRILQHHGLTIFDVQQLPTHGGSLRVFARHAEDHSKPVATAVDELQTVEVDKGYDRLTVYASFAERVRQTKRNLLSFLIQAKRDGRRVVGYGAPGKGNTLLNYCGIREDFLDFTVDRNPMKQNTFLPGSRIPVYAPEMIARVQPDFVLILPWNLKSEIVRQLDYIRRWGGKCVIPIPDLSVLD